MNLTLYADGYLKAGDKTYRAVYGRNGIGTKFNEGDGISPEGTWPLRSGFFRGDRLKRPRTQFPFEIITPNHAWCDIVGHPDYNKLVMDPNQTREESFWRDDNLYDIVIPIGFNDDPVVNGLDSAIFFHIARSNYGPSGGCASISLPDMLEVVPVLTLQSTLTFTRETLRGEPVKWPYNPPSP